MAFHLTVVGEGDNRDKLNWLISIKLFTKYHFLSTMKIRLGYFRVKHDCLFETGFGLKNNSSGNGTLRIQEPYRQYFPYPRKILSNHRKDRTNKTFK
jgi:hypothetical protein